MTLAKLIFSLFFVTSGLPFPSCCPNTAIKPLMQSLHHQRPTAAYPSKKGRTWSLVIDVGTIRLSETPGYGGLTL